MEALLDIAADEVKRARRLVARQAFGDFYAICFWWYPRDFEVTEEAIPLIVRELRAAGGHAGLPCCGGVTVLWRSYAARSV